MPSPARSATSSAAASSGFDLAALEAVSQAVASGAGVPEVVRAAARALDASLVLLDRASSVLAVAARSPADERSLMTEAAGVETHDLRVGDAEVGRLRLRARTGAPPPAVLQVILTLIASEVERVRAPERASEAAQTAFLRAVLDRTVTDRRDIVARGEEIGIRLIDGGAVVVVRAHHFAPVDDDWRARVLATAEHAARATAPGSLAALRDAREGGHVVTLVPARDAAAVARVAEAVARELASALPGFTFAVGHSRVASDPVDLHRAGHEAALAANVAEAGSPSGEATRRTQVLAFEDTGSYRLLLPAMSEDRAELEAFYAETVGRLAAYDDQYETDLVQTLETFLECDGNVAGSAQRLFTHRHTIRYRLERVRDISGLDVGSSDGRERLSLGLKAMRVLGISAPHGPAREVGAAAGRVPRETKDR
jgi:sugar diacid utilization regulator